MMDILHKVALQGLKKSRARTLVTIVGVALSAALITAVATFGVSLLSYMTDGAARKYGGWHVGFLNADAGLAQQCRQDRETAATVAFENVGYAKLEGGKDSAKPYLFIAGFGKEALDALPITLLSGRLPQNGGEALLSGSVASKGGVSYAVGDTLTLMVGSRASGEERLWQGDPYRPGAETLVPQGCRTYAVVGICQTPAFEEDSAPGYTLIAGEDGADAGSSLALFVTLKNPRRVHACAASMAQGRAYILNHNVLRFMGLSDDAGDRIFNALLYSVSGIVIAIIMIGSVFLIHNAFQISLNERTQQIGLLASVGATPRQIRNSVLFEGLCIGAVGVPIGVAVGLGGIGAVISVVANRFGSLLYSKVPLTLTLSVPALVAAAAVSLITILISAYIPAKKAAGTPVMECIRQTGEVKVAAGDVKTSGLALRVYGLEGILALKSFKRNKKRYRSVVLSLVLSIVLFVSASAFVMNLRQAAEQARAVTTYDVGFGTRDMDDREMRLLYDRLKTVDGVYQSSYQAVLRYRCAVSADMLSEKCRASVGVSAPDEAAELPLELQFLDDETYLKIIGDLGLPAGEFLGPDAKIIAVAKMQDDSKQEVGQLDDMFVNAVTSLAITSQAEDGLAQEKTRTVSAVCVETVPPDIPPVAGASQPQPFYFYGMAPYSLKESLAPSDAPANIRVKGLTFQSASPSRSTAEMRMVIEGLGITAPYLLMNTSEMFEDSRNYIFIANVFAYTFIVMISLIAVANVFNTISTNIRLRRRELAMLRSVGMPDRDFNKMMRFECAFYGLRALLYGLPIAAACSFLIYWGMFSGGADGVAFAIPWVSVGISVLSVLLVIFVTMMYAVKRLRKENIIVALRDDMA